MDLWLAPIVRLRCAVSGEFATSVGPSETVRSRWLIFAICDEPRLSAARHAAVVKKAVGAWPATRLWGAEKFQSDPQWRDHLLYYEYFHGDNGAGLGASHQTGWTGLVAKNIEVYGFLDAKRMLEVGRQAAFSKAARAAG